MLALLVAISIVMFAVFGLLFTDLGLDGWSAAVAATLMLTWLGALSVPGWRWRLVGRFPGRASQRWAQVVLGIWVAVYSSLVALALAPSLRSLAFPLGLLAAIAYGPIAARAVKASVAQVVVNATLLVEPDDADEMVSACRYRLTDRGLGPAQVAQVQINLARALVVRSGLRYGRDGLIEAGQLLGSVVRTGASDMGVTYQAADELLRAMRVLEQKHGDRRGIDGVLAMREAAALRIVGGQDAYAMRALTEASRLAVRADDAATTADSSIARALHARATAEARTAAAAAPPDHHLHIETTRLLVHLLRRSSSLQDLDEAVQLACALYVSFRGTAANARGVRRRLADQEAADGAVALADVLLARAGQKWVATTAAGSNRSTIAVDTDTADAVVLCSALVDTSEPDPDASFVVARALALRMAAGLPASPGMQGPQLPSSTSQSARSREPASPHSDNQRVVSAAFRRAIEASRRRPDRHVQLVARAWAEWATAEELENDAADALWELVATLSAESMSKLTRETREGVVAADQGVTAAAGYWLIAAGRPADAAVAIERGRALLFTGPARYFDPDLRAQLEARGRRDLWDIWAAAARRVDAAYRSQMLLPSISGPSLATDYSSKEQRAWAQLDDASHAITDELGRAGSALPTIADLSQWVGSDTIVYVGSTARGGYALVVGPSIRPSTAKWPPQGVTPVSLPLLSSAEVDRWTAEWHATRTPPRTRWPEVIAAMLEWLDEAFAGPLRAVLPAGHEFVLVALGPLGLLPLHAVGAGTGASDGSPAFVVRSAPNARTAARARVEAARAEAMPLAVVAIDAPDVPGRARLAHARAEAAGVRALYGRAGRHLPSATLDDARPVLAQATIWHLACHGEARLEAPLESAVILKDGALTLKELLAQDPSAHRLAVLSACDTNVPDLDLLDEVVSLPGGLLRAGVAGIVASQWAVDDRAAAHLMLRLHHLLRSGLPPAHALSQAQSWLRTATNADLHAADPLLAPEPVGLPAIAVETWRRRRPFRHPGHWAAFAMTGA